MEIAKSTVQCVPLDKLIAHPDNPNRQSKGTFAKLVRNIKRSGRYEPLLVRPHPERAGFFQIINGHHRKLALEKLGYKEAEAIVWEVGDEEADILLATLNRLCGTDRLEKKLVLLRRLGGKLSCGELSKLLPQTARQIERLTNFKLPEVPAKAGLAGFANPMVFFVDDEQKRTVEEALAMAEENISEKSKAGKRAAALSRIAAEFVLRK